MSISHTVPDVVRNVTRLIFDTLASVENAKPTLSIDPALTIVDFGDIFKRLDTLFDEDEGNRYEILPEGIDRDRKRQRRNAVVESATRNSFAKLIAETTIESPKFIYVWNLLDLLSILSDTERCEPALIFWIIEELLDTQTIAGCRQVFDYLESRRERITAKNFKAKHLVILRTCNELLRRLSRAEDTSFCGRVFIFMFQSFPLGDKSSVNLRGEYHVENVTNYDQDPISKDEGDGDGDGDRADAMEMDEKPSQADQNHVDFESLYPVFWSLQDSFSQPKKLFQPENFTKFKEALETSIRSLRDVRDNSNTAPTNSVNGKTGHDENRRAGMPRLNSNSQASQTTNNVGTLDASNFNPKYLTNRDLFELEVRDLSFRRHVLVQALIIMDFIISLTAKSKEKLNGLTALNKSVAYMDQVVSEQDAEWALEMKQNIVDFLKPDPEGPFYMRMVETVLSRDKNWVRWKIENCPSIEQPAITADLYLESVDSLSRLTANWKPRQFPLGGLSLDFLNDDSDSEETPDVDVSDKFTAPTIPDFRGKLGDIEFDLVMETDENKKAMLEDRKAGASWQALRLTSLSHIAAFDRIDSIDKIDAIYSDRLDPDAPLEPELGENVEMPEDLKLVVLAGEEGTGRSALLKGLMEKNPGIFKKVARHTTRPKKDDEEPGVYIHVDKKAFLSMLDCDQLVECVGDRDVDENFEGLSKRLIDTVQEAGKVPIVITPYSSVEWMRDVSGYSARSILIRAVDASAIESQAKAADLEDEKAVALGKQYAEASAKPDYEKGFDYVLINKDLDSSIAQVMKFVYGENPHAAGEKTEVKEDTEMDDVEGKTGESDVEKEEDGEVKETVHGDEGDETEEDEDDAVDLVKAPITDTDGMEGVEAETSGDKAKVFVKDKKDVEDDKEEGESGEVEKVEDSKMADV